MAGRLNRFLGGSPLVVVGKLILLSILFGVVLSALGIEPWNIVSSLRRFILNIWDMGFGAFKWIWQYFLLGAVVVVPVWLVVRLFRAPSAK